MIFFARWALPFGYYTNYFRYTRISPVQGTAHWVASLGAIGGQANLLSEGSSPSPADRCQVVYCCARKGCTF